MKNNKEIPINIIIKSEGIDVNIEFGYDENNHAILKVNNVPATLNDIQSIIELFEMALQSTITYNNSLNSKNRNKVNEEILS